MTQNKTIYCYETKQKFESIRDAELHFNLPKSSLYRVLNKPTRTYYGYHWCTDLSLFDGKTLKYKKSQKIFCYETKQEYKNLKDTKYKNVHSVLNNPNKTIGGYHWCTDLSIFDSVKLISGIENKYKQVFCYETKQKFDSIVSAKKWLSVQGINDNISAVINKSNRSTCGYHWCTSLEIFDGVNLTSGTEKPVYCYETKQKFNSMIEASNFAKLQKSNNISKCLNIPNKTAGGYHWCNNLDIFDGVELSNCYDKFKIPVYCYETKEYFKSAKYAAIKYNLINRSSIFVVLDKHNRTAGGHHWCTSLDIFDGVELIYPESGISCLEKEIADYIKLIYSGEIVENSRNIISPQELDIYIPELKLAFEFNGDYWHSDAHKPKNYHIDKTNSCKSKGIQLIHIYEYQWKTNKEVWLSFIANKLKVNPNKIYARKCEIKLVESNISKQFQIDNHLQGYVNSKINLGLYYNDELVSLMTFGKPRFTKCYEYELLRFCNKKFVNVVGGASKLLKYFEVNYKPKSLLSYAEIDYSDGKLYHYLNFSRLNSNDLNYVWQKYNEVLPRYKTMKHKLEKLLNHGIFDANLSETENMNNNGYNKLWKCGTYTFIKNY